ncbi:MAG: 2,3-bisphosphoglycerate-independent phosphoglycerate mutase [bacterium]|nr:2,3-bisphosphoglycerate-independent phosphoglycerate mutase [bacterium]
MKIPVILLILDGFGISLEKKGNAIAQAKIPNLKSISENYLGATLQASGIEVGLGWGEMGSSEVGHTNLGAGLVSYQNLPRISSEIKNKNFYKLLIWKNAVEHAEKNNSDLHLMGLVSNGGVHSHIDHLFALLDTIKELGFTGNLWVHFFTDGQDTAPKIAVKFIEPLEKKLAEIKIGKIATVIGRYYSMDKNQSWDRTEKAYKCLTEGVGQKFKTPEEAVEAGYKNGLRDETLEPAVIENAGLIKNNDAVIFFNFRADRARQIGRAFTSDDFKGFQRKKLNNLFFATLTDYGLNTPVEIAFQPEYITNPLAKVISDAGKTQFHIAETEKYAHVTYFFNGGTEKEFKGEDREIIPSKKVKSYEETPEMSAKEITNRAIKEIEGGRYDFLVVNLANGDMVGHTGNLKAGIQAIETLDVCVGKIMESVLKAGGTLLITGDHGNVEEMINLETNEIDKEHSTNPVPLWIVGEKYKLKGKPEPKTSLMAEGLLGDVAPTILEIMDLPKPKEMTGNSLLNIITNCSLP